MFDIKNSHLILSGPYLTIGKIDRQPLLGRGRGTRTGTEIRGREGGIDGRFKATSHEGASPALLHSTTDCLQADSYLIGLVYLSFDKQTSLIGAIQSALIDYRLRAAPHRRHSSVNDQVK